MKLDDIIHEGLSDNYHDIWVLKSHKVGSVGESIHHYHDDSVPMGVGGSASMKSIDNSDHMCSGIGNDWSKPDVAIVLHLWRWQS